MPSTDSIVVHLDVDLSDHARQLLDEHTNPNGMSFAPPPPPSQMIRDWLLLETAAIECVASIAGDGARLIVDEKLSKLAQLVELVAVTERRLAERESDLVKLAKVAQGAAANLTAARAEHRVRLATIADRAIEASDVDDPGTEWLLDALAAIVVLARADAALVDDLPLLEDDVEPCGAGVLGSQCTRARGHDGNHVNILNPDLADGLARAAIEEEGE